MTVDTKLDTRLDTGLDTILTHIALPVRDLAATLAFYAKYTNLAVIHERVDAETGLRTAWLANARDRTAPGAARVVIVLIDGKLPTRSTGSPPGPATTGACCSARCTATRSSATSAWSPTPTATTSNSPSSRYSADAMEA